MRTCTQFEALDVLEHGRMVSEAFKTMLFALRAGVAPNGWRLPGWLLEARDAFLSRLLPEEQLHWYQLYHDCGKPLCRVTDSEGRVHFPGHAQASGEAWRAHGGCSQIARLMELDMAFHLCSADEIKALAQLPEAASLYLTALAEIHANAQMFGGLESISFKSKLKHLDRRGKALLKNWQG